jgi:dTDP-4-amino-4,6-dideoxygalactose transaminase
MAPAALEAALASPPSGLPPIAAIVLVHLYGQPADLEAIPALARRHGLRVIEDCAQSHGATFAGRLAGSFGDVASFSFYPTKNLGALGDGGMVTTADEALAGELKAIREYGWRGRRYVSERTGMNTRLDELQAAILRVKLTRLAADNVRRRAIAARYDAGLRGLPLVTPACDPRAEHVYHQYVVRVPGGGRDALRARLQEAGIGTNIHYPMPVHLQPGYQDKVAVARAGLGETERAANEILSLPMYPQLGDDAVDRVVASVATALRG